MSSDAPDVHEALPAAVVEARVLSQADADASVEALQRTPARSGPSAPSAPGDAGADAARAGQNPRFERFEAALTKFLQLIDHKATEAAVRSTLPHMDAKLLEAARAGFIGELKARILESSALVAAEYQLEPRLLELQQLVEEADERLQNGVVPGAEEAKDVWRPDLDIETAVSARSVAAQRENVASLEAELAELEAENRAAAGALKHTLAQADGRQGAAREMLTVLEESIAGLEPDAETETQMRAVVEALLAELGPRTAGAPP